MNSIKSWIGRIFKKGTSTTPAPQPSIALVLAKTPPAMVRQPMTELDLDNERYRSRSTLPLLPCHHLEEELKKKYSADALTLMLSILTEMAPAATKEIALQNLTETCQAVNQVYPLNWQVVSNAVTHFGSTSRYKLIAHSLWLNANGAYCIVDNRKSARIFYKAAADTSAFAEPPGFGNGA